MGLFRDGKAAVSIGVIALIIAFMLVASTLTIIAVNFGRYGEIVRKANMEVQLKQAENIKVVQVDEKHIKIENYGQHPALIVKLAKVNPDNRRFEVMNLDSPVAVPPLEEKTITLPENTPESWEVGALTSRGNMFWETVETEGGAAYTYAYQGTISAGDIYKMEDSSLTRKTQGLVFFDNFERSNLRDSQHPWSTSGGSYSGEGDWYTTTDSKKYGSRSACSNPRIDNYEASWMYVYVNMPRSGYIRFWWKVSSQRNHDFLRFYVDSSQKARISGYVNWQAKEFSIPSGSHKIMFKYTKDSFGTRGADKGWVDQVYVWVGSKTITVQNVKAGDIIKIYDSSGNVVKQTTASSSTVNIDVSDLISQNKLPIFNGKIEVTSGGSGGGSDSVGGGGSGGESGGEESSGSTQTIDFIYDTFTSGLDGWTLYQVKHGGWGMRYRLTRDTGTGCPAPSAYIYGDGYYGDAGMQKIVDISRWTGEAPLTLSFNWRAKSNYRGSTVTNAHVKILDASTGQQLYYKKLVAGGTYDTGWRSFSADISGYVKGHSKIKIILYLHDAWAWNWHQKNWYDNVRLRGEAYT